MQGDKQFVSPKTTEDVQMEDAEESKEESKEEFKEESKEVEEAKITEVRPEQ